MADIVIDASLQIRDSLDEETVSSYMEDFDLLPAALVFETPAGLLLADGFHRIEAARRLGRAQITAEVQTGTRVDAVGEAIKRNLAHGRRYTQAERGKAIRLFEDLHQDWSTYAVAAALRCAQSTVVNIRQARSARARAQEEAINVDYPAPDLSETHYMAIGSAPPEMQGSLAHAADERRWSKDETLLWS